MLEITTPTRAPLAQFYGLWFDRVVPALGALRGAGRDARAAALDRGGGCAPPGGPAAWARRAMPTLPNSVKRFPAPPALAAELERAGLREIRYLLTAGGIVSIHLGTVPRAMRRHAAGSRDAGGPATSRVDLEAIMRARRRAALRELMARSERHLERVTSAPASRWRRTRARHGRRGRQAAAPAARRARGRGRRRAARRRGRRGTPGARGGRRRARALRDARARRPDRRRPAAPRAPDGRRRRRPRRSPSRRATCCSRERSPSSLSTRTPPCCARCRMPARPSPQASCSSARTPTPPTSPSSATCAAASSRPPRCSRPPAGWAR